ncbi:hypothetical protein AB0O54_06230 [Pseudarthrobacter oxydans]|uniref:hypothetical protein n=1 Tax=Pseudarthrobacter oxydans TaxID=1671 RepID=UPI00343166C1
MTWMELFYRRFVGQLSGVPAAPKTEQAEILLDGGRRQTYYYVGRCMPAYGALCVAHDGPIAPDQPTRTCPFDTGGVVHGKIRLASNLSLEDKVSVVESNTYEGSEYERPFETWAAASFRSMSNYVRGERPSSSLVPEIELGSNEAFAWTWEGRHRATDRKQPLLTPIRVYMRRGHPRLYKEWLRQSRLLDTSETVIHLQRLADVLEETPDPAGQMMRFLESRVTP